MINKPVADVDEWISNQQNLVDNSELLESSETVKEFNDNAFLLRRQMKGNAAFEPRDLALFRNKIQLTDGSIGHVTFSVVHDSIPETDCVRAEASVSLEILQSTSDTR